jgi:hypothetical protein
MTKTYKETSAYYNTPVKDFYLDLWTSVSLEPQETDQRVVISSKHHLRPDKLAYEMYGNPELFWVFAIRNKDYIIDPINDFVAGKVIYVPSAQYVRSVL